MSEPEAVTACDKPELIRSFNAAADSYAAAARLQKYAEEQLLERLELIRIDPLTILDLGSGPGVASRALSQRYPAARVIEFDIAENMLRHSRKNRSAFTRRYYLCGDADRLPLADNSVDLVFSNLMLQWSQDPDRLLAGLRAALRPGGLFLFCSLGPDTLRELRGSWSAADNRVHVNTFIDMHDLGDALVRAGFADPVMEAEQASLAYSDVDTLMHDLKDIGAHNLSRERRRTLTGKQRFSRMRQEYERYRENGRLPATYELIYGHAWISGETAARPRGDRTLFSIPLERVMEALRKKPGGAKSR